MKAKSGDDELKYRAHELVGVPFFADDDDDIIVINQGVCTITDPETGGHRAKHVLRFATADGKQRVTVRAPADDKFDRIVKTLIWLGSATLRRQP